MTDDIVNEISEDTLAILVCPKCHASVVKESDTIKCTGKECGLVYPIRSGIPVMLIDEATAPKQISLP